MSPAVSRWLPTALAAAVVVRMAFHAAFVPAFEGPDEPYHLARALAFADKPFAQALRGAPVESPLVEAVRGKPCSENLHRVFGCPLFGSEPARFDVLAPDRPGLPSGPLSNTEDNQPPLAYLLAGLALKAWPGTLPASRALLIFRLLAVACVTAALFGPLRRMARGRPSGLAIGVLILLLTPGASEALARASNDAAVFLWAALLVEALDRRASTGVTLALLAAGPLFKLTAFPVVVFAVVAIWKEGRRRLALRGGILALAVFPLQALRGWNWGGTLEFNQAAAAAFSVRDAAVGLVRSAYTFWKTTFWLGEWSFFRAPRLLVGAYLLLWIAALLLARRRADPQRVAAHALGALAAACGFLAFAVGNRLYYGDWGGVGGWYAWSWLPWLAAAGADLATMERRAGARLLAALAVFVLAANVLWFAKAWPLYGTHTPPLVIPSAAREPFRITLPPGKGSLVAALLGMTGDAGTLTA